MPASLSRSFACRFAGESSRRLVCSRERRFWNACTRHKGNQTSYAIGDVESEKNQWKPESPREFLLYGDLERRKRPRGEMQRQQGWKRQCEEPERRIQRQAPRDAE